MLLHDGGNRAAFEWHISRQHLKKNDAEAVDVTALVGLFIRPLLGRHVVGRTNDSGGLRADERAKQISRLNLGEAEIEDTNLIAHRPAGLNHYVQRLEIAVHDAVIVSRPDGGRDHTHVFKRLLRREWTLSGHQRLKRLALDKLHHD